MAYSGMIFGHLSEWVPMDRLERNVSDLRELVAAINRDGASVRFHKEGLEFSGEDSPMSELDVSRQTVY